MTLGTVDLRNLLCGEGNSGVNCTLDKMVLIFFTKLHFTKPNLLPGFNMPILPIDKCLTSLNICCLKENN